jgi:hypothetical protein
MDEHKLPPPGDEPPEIADAEALFHDASAPSGGVRQRPVEPTSSSPVEAYEVEEQPEPSRDRESVPIEPVGTRRKNTSGPGRMSVSAAGVPTRDPSEAVDEVWTRSAEWSRSVLLLVGVGIGVGALIYLLLLFEEFGLAFLVLLAGGVALAVLSYPILITLERPVRVTPEQAVHDYFVALSHHVPHYRRMWLLLSNAGRSAGGFATFDGFRRYWKTRLAELRGGKSSAFTPLKFQVHDFKSEKSAGKSEISVTFTVRVLVRGRQTEGPIATIPVKTTLVKGPDKMWYLDRGTLP